MKPRGKTSFALSHLVLTHERNVDMSSQSACPSERYARSFIPSSGLWDFFEGGKQCLEPSGVPQLDMDRRLLGEQPEEARSAGVLVGHVHRQVGP